MSLRVSSTGQLLFCISIPFVFCARARPTNKTNREHKQNNLKTDLFHNQSRFINYDPAKIRTLLPRKNLFACRSILSAEDPKPGLFAASGLLRNLGEYEPGAGSLCHIVNNIACHTISIVPRIKRKKRKVGRNEGKEGGRKEERNEQMTERRN